MRTYVLLVLLALMIILVPAYRVFADSTECVSVSYTGGPASGSTFPPEEIAISGDGRCVVFRSSFKDLVPNDANGADDLFLRDRFTGVTEIVSLRPDGSQATGGSGNPAISLDGRFVAFTSSSPDLVPGDTNGVPDTFVRDRLLGITERVSVATGGAQANGASAYHYDISISADGRYVAFASEATNLVEGDTNGKMDIFVRDRQLGITERISVSSNGEEAENSSYGTSISADGRYVAFESRADNLVPGDTNGYDVFVRDRQIGTTECVSVNGERYIDAVTVRPIDDFPVASIALSGRAVGGGSYLDSVTQHGQSGVTEGVGLNNIGFLIKAWGRVTQKGNGYLYIDDGSNIQDGTMTNAEDNIGVRVICDPTVYNRGGFLVVTGISSCFETPSGEIARRILTRRAEDIKRIAAVP